MSQQKLLTIAARDTAAAGRRVAQGRKWAVQGVLYLTLAVFLVLTFVPLAIMVTMSFRNNGQIYANFWGLPDPWLFSNYVQGFTSVIHYAVNSVADSLASVALIVVLSSLSGYVFARHRFPPALIAGPRYRDCPCHPTANRRYVKCISRATT